MRALVLLAALASPGAASVGPEMDRRITACIDAIYRMDFDASEREARRLIELEPAHPYGHFGLAAASWARYTYGTERTDHSLVAPFERRVEEAVAKARLWLKARPKDAEAWMIAGSAYGLAARMMSERRDWLKAYAYGRRAIKYTRKAAALDPELHDARLGLGMYDYYSDLYPRLVRVLARLLLRGDRARGLAELKLVAEKGRYTKTAAKMLLVDIYTSDPFGARDPAEAMRLMREIRAEYPASSMLHAAELVSLHEARRYEDEVREAREFLRLCAAGRYPALDRAKGSVILGTALWASGRREEALSAFLGGADVTIGPRLSRWAVWASVRAGQAADLLGRREEALRHYRAAVREPDDWGLGALAKGFLRRPCARFVPDGISPP